MSNLSRRTKMVHILANQAAATTTQNTSAVDMQGFDGVVFIGRFATVHATSKSFNVAQSTASGGTFSDLAGTAIRGKTDFRVDVYRPRERYLRGEYHRASGALGSSWAILYSGRRLSTTATETLEVHLSPTEGTA